MLICFEKKMLNLKVSVRFPAKLHKSFYWDPIFVLNFLGFENEITTWSSSIFLFDALGLLYQMGPRPCGPQPKSSTDPHGNFITI